MRTIEKVIYTAQELREQHPAGFARAFEAHCQSEMQWADWSDEWASLKAVDKAAGWDRGYRAYWWADRNADDVWSLEGRRAWAWLENVLLGPLREPWRKPGKRSRWTKPGHVPDCPFTGYYMDDVILDAIRDGLLRRGMTVGQVFAGLPDEVERVINGEIESRCDEDYFIERADDSELEFYENGEQA